jgi:hypothetical protein
MVRRTLDIMGLRATVYGTCAAIVLVCLALVVWAMLHSTKAVVPQHDSIVPNHGVPQYYSPVLPHCYTPCILGDMGVHSA